MGSNKLSFSKLDRKVYIQLPFPNGISSIYDLTDGEREDYAKRVIDLITMEIGSSEENYHCFFQNLDYSFLFTQLKERTNFKIFSFFNEHFLSYDLNIPKNIECDINKNLPIFSEKNIYTSLEVARFLNKRFIIPAGTLEHWPYRASNLINSGKGTDNRVHYSEIVKLHKIVTFYGQIFSQASLSLLTEVIIALTKNSTVKIFLIGSFDYDFILERINETTKQAITFVGKIEEGEFQKLVIVSTCIVYLGDKEIADNSFLFILENFRRLITFKKNIPFEYRKHVCFQPIESKSKEKSRLIKVINKNIVEALNHNIHDIQLRRNNLQDNDLRASTLEKIIFSITELKHI